MVQGWRPRLDEKYRRGRDLRVSIVAGKSALWSRTRTTNLPLIHQGLTSVDELFVYFYICVCR